MSEVNKVLNFSSVVTKCELLKVSLESYLELVAEGKKEKDILERSYQSIALKEMIGIKPLEIANSNRYAKKSSTEKTALATEITFANQLEKIINVLIGMEINYNRLYFICRYIEKTKQGGPRDISYEKLCISICKMFALHYGISNPTIILTKLNTILIYHKALYKKNEENHKKQQIKIESLESKEIESLTEKQR